MAEQTGKRGANNPTTKGSGFDPRAPSLTQPYKRLVDEGFITELIVKFTPTGVTCTGKPDSRVANVKDSGVTAGVDTGLGLILAAAERGNLIPRRAKKTDKKTEGKALPLPEKSLCKRDFEGTDAELLARAKSVCKANGGPSLVGRVRSQGSFNGTVTTSFEEWWKTADAINRAKSLCIPSKGKELDEADIARIGKMPCPFRGTAEFTVVDEEEEEDAPTNRASSSINKS